MRYSIVYIKYPRSNKHFERFGEITNHKIIEGNSEFEAATNYLISKFEEDFEIDYNNVICDIDNKGEYYNEELEYYKNELMKCKNFQELKDYLDIEWDYINVLEIPELKQLS